ncbi:MAG: 30S ribosome-binding factor RbfA [Pseudomonadota bacterium]
MKKSYGFDRTERVSAELQRALANLLQHAAHDARLQQVTIQEVRVARDLSHAQVYYTSSQSMEKAVLTQILNKAAGYLRHELAQQLTLRTVPVLNFIYDISVETGQHLTQLIDRANQHISDGTTT